MPLKWTKRLRLLLLFWALLFSIVALILKFKPNETFQLINEIGVFFHLPLDTVAYQKEVFSQVFVVAFFLLFIYLCLFVVVDIKRRVKIVGTILFALISLSAIFVMVFVMEKKSLLSIAGIVIPILIFFLTYPTYLKAKKEVIYKGFL